MSHPASLACTAFEGPRRLASGPLGAVVLAVKHRLEAGTSAPVLTLDDQTGQVLDLDTRGTEAEVLARLASPPSGEVRGRGRPKLGVVPREVTLLPRHWEWLNAQPGGASVALRKLVEEARKAGHDARREAQERTYRLLSVLGGDTPGYEEALRALYAGDREAFLQLLQPWPADVRDHILQHSLGAFPPQA